MHKDNMQMLKDTLELDAMEGGIPYEAVYFDDVLYESWVFNIQNTFEYAVKVWGFKEAMLSMIILNNGMYYIN